MIEACVTAIVFGAEDGDDGIAPSVVDADGRRVESFEPGLIAYARRRLRRLIFVGRAERGVARTSSSASRPPSAAMENLE